MFHRTTRRVPRVPRVPRVRLVRRAVIAAGAAAVLAGTTGAAFPAQGPEHHQPSAAVLQKAPAPHAPEGDTHKLIRDQIDIDLDESDRHHPHGHRPR
ncbi:MULTISPECIES: hypothetical protein [Streptomyces]|uniref:Secreted protein n=1 Tax=Streptomyces venezuelae TaxID=54571 RepID=A0A5P2BIF8_STRVZ|nr:MULTISPECIES: hypothetical protein [Streptomyces]NEA01463.1 hypothetical protein [Streptomyces sp. SID10116]MYY83272.1 hypothetical protein [Streptomyces sp. SID335]MYZ12938.1 hypothetical protein [Streptomyces sp. SID337]NDZ87274.1 hypothetical protein [Streptomyces sp. SID10115]NEB43238.1 hypothetical protein [Streptomyces sp. SID339]